ncbi:protein canopy 4-like [Saccostrea echinata]|uniref:protein canopy 4-like n=1 Tax=Saccostrea echinata TaxID=191078 RepID=UPI002A838042|nr:protein canopy 4-like [Saccostrea echinata]
MRTAYISLILFFYLVVSNKGDNDDSGVILPSMCEVCKFFVTELQSRLDETGKSKETLHVGHGLDKKKKIVYNKSELRLTEALTDPHICDKILEYNVHKERSGSNRFAKGRSETMDTLHGLVNKGVKVELGIPYELWDSPSAEVTDMQRKCFKMAEEYEDEIENWYYKHQDKDLMNYLCANIILRKDDNKCLTEKYVPKGETEEGDKKEKSSKKEKKKSKPKGDEGEKEAKDEL